MTEQKQGKDVIRHKQQNAASRTYRSNQNTHAGAVGNMHMREQLYAHICARAQSSNLPKIFA